MFEHRRTLMLIPALLVAMVAAPLGAAEFYAGAGLGGGVEGGTAREGVEGLADTHGDAWKLFVGARVGRHLGFEVGRYELSEQTCCPDVADLGFLTQVDGYSAAALGRWPVGRLTPFVRAGVLAWEEEGESITLIGPRSYLDDGTDLLLGAGIDLELATRLGVRAEWERFEFGSVSSDSVWGSVLIRF